MKHETWTIIAGACLLLCVACSSTDMSSQSQTHWLRACKGDAECGSFSCACGVCVEPCGSGGRCDPYIN